MGWSSARTVTSTATSPRRLVVSAGTPVARFAVSESTTTSAASRSRCRRRNSDRCPEPISSSPSTISFTCSGRRSLRREPGPQRREVEQQPRLVVDHAAPVEAAIAAQRSARRRASASARGGRAAARRGAHTRARWARPRARRASRPPRRGARPGAAAARPARAPSARAARHALGGALDVLRARSPARRRPGCAPARPDRRAPASKPRSSAAITVSGAARGQPSASLSASAWAAMQPISRRVGGDGGLDLHLLEWSTRGRPAAPAPRLRQRGPHLGRLRARRQPPLPHAGARPPRARRLGLGRAGALRPRHAGARRRGA